MGNRLAVLDPFILSSGDAPLRPSGCAVPGHRVAILHPSVLAGDRLVIRARGAPLTRNGVAVRCPRARTGDGLPVWPCGRAVVGDRVPILLPRPFRGSGLSPRTRYGPVVHDGQTIFRPGIVSRCVLCSSRPCDRAFRGGRTTILLHRPRRLRLHLLGEELR